jgi:O-antigen/teichoic acid export membrane protein
LPFLDRIPRHLLVAGTAWGSRVVTSVVALLNIRLLTSHLAAEGYAAFALLHSLAGWYALADFGLASALHNRVARARAQGEGEDASLRALLWVAVYLFLLVSVLMGVLGHWLGPAYLAQLQASNLEKWMYFSLSAIMLMGLVVGGTAYRVWYAEQRGFLANALLAVAALLSLGLVWIVTRTAFEPRLLFSLLAVEGAQGSVALLCLGQMLWRARARVRIEWPKVRAVLREAQGFWWIAVMAAGTLNVDYLFMSRFLGSEDIVRYNIVTRVFETIRLFYGGLLIALWPTYTTLFTQNKWGEAMANLRRYTGLGLAGIGLFGLFMVFFRDSIVDALSPKTEVRVATSFILLVTAAELVRVFATSFTTVLMSLGETKSLVKIIAAQSAVNIALQFILIPRMGLQGIPLGVMLSMLTTSVWACPYALRKAARGRNPATHPQ